MPLLQTVFERVHRSSRQKLSGLPSQSREHTLSGQSPFRARVPTTAILCRRGNQNSARCRGRCHASPFQGWRADGALACLCAQVLQRTRQAPCVAAFRNAPVCLRGGGRFCDGGAGLTRIVGGAEQRLLNNTLPLPARQAIPRRVWEVRAWGERGEGVGFSFARRRGGVHLFPPATRCNP